MIIMIPFLVTLRDLLVYLTGPFQAANTFADSEIHNECTAQQLFGGNYPGPTAVDPPICGSHHKGPSTQTFVMLLQNTHMVSCHILFHDNISIFDSYICQYFMDFFSRDWS